MDVLKLQINTRYQVLLALCLDAAFTGLWLLEKSRDFEDPFWLITAALCLLPLFALYFAWEGFRKTNLKILSILLIAVNLVVILWFLWVLYSTLTEPPINPGSLFYMGTDLQ